MSAVGDILQTLIDEEIEAVYGTGLSAEDLETYRTMWMANLIRVIKTARA